MHQRANISRLTAVIYSFDFVENGHRDIKNETSYTVCREGQSRDISCRDNLIRASFSL